LSVDSLVDPTGTDERPHEAASGLLTR